MAIGMVEVVVIVLHCVCLFASLQTVRDMVYAHKIRIAHMAPREEVEGVIERPFEWIFFEMPVTEVCELVRWQLIGGVL